MLKNTNVSDKEIAVIEKKVSPMVSQASKLEISSPKTMETASEMRSKLKAIEKEVTADHKKLTDPLKQVIKDINAKYEPFETALDDALTLVTDKMSTYQTEEKARADAEAKKIADRIGDGKGKLQVDTAIRQIGEIEKPEAVVRTDFGATKFRTDKKFRVVNESLIPREYLVVDEVKVRNTMKAGIEIAGIEYYEVQTPINSR